jgi:hypothetical protein
MNIESSTTTVPLAPVSGAPKVSLSVGAQLSFWAASTFLALLAALHVLKPDLNPSIWPQVTNLSGQIGLICLTLAGIALAVAGAFISDPITVAKDQAHARHSCGHPTAARW